MPQSLLSSEVQIKTEKVVDTSRVFLLRYYVPFAANSNAVELCRNYEYVMYVLSVKFKR